jgi:hypothetical protein
MSEKKQISQDRWVDYLNEVSAGNRGRLIAVDVIAGNEVSSKPEIDIPVAGAPLLALEYEPVNKGNAIILSTGEQTVDYEHAINATVELIENLDANGELDFLEFCDQNGARTKLNFL